MFEIVGYCVVKQGAKGISPAPLSDFYQKPIRAFEINKETNAVLLINNAATAIATFDLSDCISYFECGEFNGILTPPNLSEFDKIIYATMVTNTPKNATRNVKDLKIFIIGSSLHKGVFTDHLYF